MPATNIKTSFIISIVALISIFFVPIKAHCSKFPDFVEYPFFEHDIINIIDNQTKKLKARFFVEIAQTPTQQSKGLMYRKSLAKSNGMLFIFKEDKVSNMWMKNTLIPLDILFIAPNGRIVKIIESAEPMSLNSLSSDIPVTATLELNSGITKKFSITIGDIVIGSKTN